MSELGVLWFLFAVGLAMWVGGAVTGRIMMARAKARKDHRLMAGLTREVAWIIPHFYIPVGIVAVFAGVVLLWLTGTSLLSTWVLFPVAVYLGIIVMGSVYSLPEYARLNRMFAERGEDAPETHRRLMRAAVGQPGRASHRARRPLRDSRGGRGGLANAVYGSEYQREGGGKDKGGHFRGDGRHRSSPYVQGGREGP